MVDILAETARIRLSALAYFASSGVFASFFVSDVTRDSFIFIGYTNSFAKTVFTGKVGDECVVQWQ